MEYSGPNAGGQSAMIRKHYKSTLTDAACSLGECRGCIINYLIETCPYMDGSPAQIVLDMNLDEEETHA